MLLEQEKLLIQFDEDANIGVVLTDTITFQGCNPRPNDGIEYGLVNNNGGIGSANERWGIVVDAPSMEIPIFADEQMVIRVLEAEAHDNWIDCEIVESEYSEFEDMLCRIPKAAITIIQHMTK